MRTLVHQNSGEQISAIPCAEPFIAYARQHYPDYHHFLARSVGPYLRRLNIVEECDSGTSLAAAVKSGRGLSLCAAIFAVAAGPKLAFLPLDPAPPPAVVGIAHRKGKVAPTTQALVQAARLASAGEA